MSVEHHQFRPSAIADKADRKKLLEQFLHTVKAQESITQFDEQLWSRLVDFVTVYSEKDIWRTFKDGTAIQACEEIERFTCPPFLVNLKR